MTKPHLSASSLRMLCECGERYRRRYIDGDVIPPGVSMVGGIAVHRAAERNLRHKLEHGALLEVDAACQVARDTAGELWNAGVHFSPDEMKEPPGVLFGQIVDFSTAATEKHATDLAPVLSPLYVERAIRLTMEGYPFDLELVVDLIDTDGVVRDLKTTRKCPDKLAAETSEQLTIYSMAQHIESCASEDDATLAALDFVVVNKKGTKAVTLLTTRNQSDYDVLLRRFEAACRVVEAGAFAPADPSWWGCSPRFCGYADTCPYYAGRRSIYPG